MSNRRAELMAMPSKMPTHSGYQPAGSYNRPDVLLSDGLFRTIARHVLRGEVEVVRALRPPRFLCIQGRPGEGKSETIRIACARMGASLIMVPAAELAGQTEGAGVDAMKHLEEVVLAITGRETAPMVVCFDDFDTSVAARRADTEYTVNSQLLEGYFQFTADSGGFKTSSGGLAAVVMTGNDFTGMRAALLRPGRAEFYTHVVSLEEKISIVGAMFPIADEKAVKSLVKSHAEEPVAFFHDLKTRLLNDDLDELYRQHGLNIAAINQAFAARVGVVDMARLKALAAQAAMTKAGSFLNIGRS